MCTKRASTVLLFWQLAAIGFALRFEVDQEMEESECAKLFESLAQPMSGEDRVNYYTWYRFFTSRSVPRKNILDFVIPAFQDEENGMLGHYGNQNSQKLNAVNWEEFKNWCLEHGDEFKNKDTNIKAIVEETVQVQTVVVDPIKQAFMAELAKGSGVLNYYAALGTLNAAQNSGKWAEIKNDFIMAMQQSWACFIHLGNKFETGTESLSREKALELFNLFQATLTRKGLTMPFGGGAEDYGPCEAWGQGRLDEFSKDSGVDLPENVTSVREQINSYKVTPAHEVTKETPTWKKGPGYQSVSNIADNWRSQDAHEVTRHTATWKKGSNYQSVSDRMKAFSQKPEPYKPKAFVKDW